MGFLGFGEKSGLDCQDDENGNKVCRKFKVRGGTKLSTGTEVTFAMDNKCEAHMVGRSSILEDDEKDVMRAKKKLESDCRGGILG